MGLLRIYLALCVVAGHAGVKLLPWPMHSSLEAVEIFFLISGFYMSLISSKYKSAIEFYTSRFLRIFFPYYVILIGVLLIIIVTGLISKNWLELTYYLNYSPKRTGLPGVAFTAITNLTVFFQDWVLFLKNDPGQPFTFTTNFAANASPLWRYEIIPPAWSIGVELTFYLFVPLLSKLRTRWLWVVAAVSLGMRVYAYQVLHLTNDPFSYRFFPFELLLFVMGMISQRIYAATLAKKNSLKAGNLIHYLIFAAVVIFILYLSQKIPNLLSGMGIFKPYAILISYAGWATIIPVLFHVTSRFSFDRFIGELSYPVYLIHYVIVEIFKMILRAYSLPKAPVALLSSIASISLAGMLYIFIFKPFEEKRPVLVQSLLNKRRAKSPNLETELGK